MSIADDESVFREATVIGNRLTCHNSEESNQPERLFET